MNKILLLKHIPTGLGVRRSKLKKNNQRRREKAIQNQSPKRVQEGGIRVPRTLKRENNNPKIEIELQKILEIK